MDLKVDFVSLCLLIILSLYLPTHKYNTSSTLRKRDDAFSTVYIILVGLMLDLEYRSMS